jgi:hypothetical protein
VQVQCGVHLPPYAMRVLIEPTFPTLVVVPSTAGSLTAEGLGAVLRWMGAAAGGPSYVCISDIREVRIA